MFELLSHFTGDITSISIYLGIALTMVCVYHGATMTMRTINQNEFSIREWHTTHVHLLGEPKVKPIHLELQTWLAITTKRTGLPHDDDEDSHSFLFLTNTLLIKEETYEENICIH